MCGISGIYRRVGGMERSRERYQNILVEMNRAQKHRGPDEEGIYLSDCCGLAHVRLSILDLSKGTQPMYYHADAEKYAIVYNGEIYNMHEIRRELLQLGMQFETDCDTEVILKGYAKWGSDIARHLNGIFAFAIWEETKKRLILCRDRLGVKPLFYCKRGEEVLFASEIKAMLAFDKSMARVDKQGLCELFALGPAHTCGKTVYQGVTEVKPGTVCRLDEHGLEEEAYWQLEGHEHEDSKDKTVEKTAFLIRDAIRMQLLSDIPVCTFLSGGLDSSIVTAVANTCMKERGMQLSTYSFDFEGNNEYFASNSFQPTQDAPYAKEMSEYLGTDHTVLICSNKNLFCYPPPQCVFDALRGLVFPRRSSSISSSS